MSGCAHRWSQLWHTRVPAHDKRQMRFRRRGTDGSQTLCWRRQSAANSSRKWSSESQVFGVPTGKWAFYPGDRPIYAIVITLIFRMQVLPRRLIFPSIKERGGSTRSKFVQNFRLFSQLRFKTHNIGSFGHDYQSGILWSRYPIKLWGRSVPCRHRMREKPRRNTSTRDTSPPGASDPRHEKQGPFCFIVIIAIKYLTIRHDMLKWHHEVDWVAIAPTSYRQLAHPPAPWSRNRGHGR